MDVQKQGIIDQVNLSKSEGRKTKDILKNLGIKSSTYYRWIKYKNVKPKPVIHPSDRVTSMSLTEADKALIVKTKQNNFNLRHRQIQGLLQNQGYYYSATSIYLELKSHGLVEKYERRPAPWDEPFYEVYGCHMMWGADWTKIRINNERWYLLTLIDFFSRKIIHWEVLKTVTASHIKNLYSNGLLSLNYPDQCQIYPELRVDRGSPNTAYTTKQFFKDIQADLSFARVRRPTDNAITERFYGTIKQEELYLVGDYQDETTARKEISNYIKYYNDIRPHQSLWNYTPNQVEEMNNKTELLNQLKLLKQKCWTERKNYWIHKKQTNHSH
jgi:transposase InsO family protein